MNHSHSKYSYYGNVTIEMLIKEREKWYERLTAGVWSEFHVWGKESRQALVSALGDCLGGALDLNQACHRQWIHFISSHEKGTGRILRGRGKESLVVMAVFLAKMFIFVLQTFVTPPTLRTSISTELAVWASSRPPPPPRTKGLSPRLHIFCLSGSFRRRAPPCCLRGIYL